MLTVNHKGKFYDCPHLRLSATFTNVFRPWHSLFHGEITHRGVDTLSEETSKQSCM